jgi:hypothetical protein
MLGSILCVTSTTKNLDLALEGYVSALNYRVVETGRIDASQANAWGAPKAAGRRFGLLAPGDGEIVYLRLIENPAAPNIRAHASLGWNVTEFNVGRVVELNAQLAGGPFRHVKGPAPLSMNTDIVAMQALGPDGELVYFTQIDPGPKTSHLPNRESGVGRVFIMVLGVRDLDQASKEFQDRLGVATTAPIRFSSNLMSEPLGLAETHEFRMGLVRLPGKFTLEIDELGKYASERPTNDGDLPPGISIVSFSMADIDQFSAKLGLSTFPAGPPFAKARAAIMRGPGGALFEVVATG